MRRLSLGVTAFLLFGSMQVMADQSTNPISESEVFTADRLAQVVDKSNMPKEGSEFNPKPVGVGILGYTHSKDSIKTINIDMAGHNLTLDLTKVADLGTDFSAYGIKSNNKTTILIDSNKTNPGKNGTITIKAKSLWSPAGDSGSKYTSAHGIAVGNHGQRFNKKVKDDLVKTTINADVMIEELRGGSTRTTGISSLDCSDLAINGKFTIKPGAISLMQWNRGDQSKTYGIYMIGSNNTVSITTADIDDSKNGSLSDLIRTEESLWGAKTEKNVLRIGGGTLKVKENQKEKNLINASKAFKAFINVNEDGSAIGTSQADLQGTIRLNEGAEAYVGLTAGSKWVGGTQADTKGKMNLFLSESGEWNTLNAGQGSRVTRLTGDAKGGAIYQKDAGQLVIENYSGAGKLFYEHENAGTKAEDYKAGDTHIGSAADGAKITVITDNKGITTTDNDQVYQVLNALAGKLYYDAYKNGETKLTGKAVIAEGLTSTAKELQFKDMLFKKENGQGYVEDKPMPPASLDVSQQIVDAGLGAENLYWRKNGYEIGQDEHQYVLKSDTTIRVNVSNPKTLHYGGNQGRHTANITWGDPMYTGDGYIDMSGHKLTLISEANHHTHSASGILSHGGDLEIKNVAGIDIDIHGNKNSQSGIYVWGQGKHRATLTIDNDDKEEHAVKIRNKAAEKDSAILVDGRSVQPGGGAKLVIKGLVDVENDDVSVIQANKGEAYIGGGKIIAKGNKASSLKVNNDGKLVLNGELSDQNVLTAGAVKHNVQIEGNVLSEKGKLGLVLNTAKSYVKGLIGTDTNTSGDTYMILSGGASWHNEGKGARTDSIGESRIKNLEADGGHIFQKHAKPITIENYKGNVKLFYEHENAGTKAEDYKAGDTHIGSAADGAKISVITDNKGITTTDNEQVYEVLNTLAGKLYYDAYKTGEKKLTGQVTIAEGLTSASQSLKMEDISFKDENGQGYVKGKVKPPAALSPITGDKKKDLYYIEKKIRQADGTYLFKEDTELRMTDGQPMVISKKPVVIKAEGKKLTFASIADTKGNVSTVKQNSKNKINITAKELVVKAENKGGRSEGISLDSTDKSVTDITGDVTIQSKGKGTALGAYVTGKAKLDIHGNVTIKGDGDTWGIENAAPGLSGAFAHYSTSGLYAGSNYNIQKGGQITVDGDVDLKVKGTGIVANGGGSTVTVKGGGQVDIEENEDDEHYALVAEGGIIHFNYDDDTAESGTKKVMIKGNVGVINGAAHANEPQRQSQIFLGLGTKDSTWKGLAVDNHTQKQNEEGYEGQLSLYMKNGATWTNEAYGATPAKFKGSKVYYLQGGMSKEESGVIFQKDKNPLYIDTYAGNMKLIYAHENMGTKPEDYKAGDTHIANASEQSWITMITDGANIDTKNENQVYQVLNTLAGKLYYDAYKNGEKNLNGEVTIAEGLTASSKTMKMKEMLFKEENGQGYIKGKETPGEDPKPPALDNPVHHQIVEANHFAEESREYWTKAGVYDGKGHYKFTKDLELVANAEDDTVGTINDNKFAAIYWNGDVDGEIDMTGHKLELKAATKTLPKQNPNTITVYSGTLRIKNTNGIYIESDPTGSLYGRGILVAGIKSDDKWNSGKGNAKLIIENDDDPAHAVKIRVKNTGEDFGAIEAQKHNGSALVDIKGLVDIDSEMWRAVESHGAKISIGGGTIKGTDVASLAAYTGGSILINAKLNDQNKLEATSTTRPVKITGDISAESGGHVMLGLNNKDSFLKGLASTDINGINPDTQKWGPIHGKVSMILANGAVWEHKQVGVGYYHKKGGNINYKNRGKGESIDSHITNLIADKGILLQNDPHKLTIDKYEGNMTLIYAHENAGTKAEDYKNGNVHIKEAAANSYITMVTDNSGIKMDDEKQVSEALNALAGKLYYEAFTKGEKNLKGQATIAEGLTASSRTLKTADLEYMDKNGQGRIKRMNPNPNPNPNPDPDPKPPIHEGDNETAMMRGGKSARTADILLWTSDTNDLQRRMGDLRLAKGETGLWAKYQGGKNKLNEQKAYISQDYNMAQVGYDKQIGDWTVGGAIHYGTANNKYIRGDGKSKITSLALYGTKQGQDGSYIDLILKGSRLSNDYTLTEDQLGRTMSGDYNTNGISFSAEYGKRMQKENGFYIEPSIELTAGRLGGKDYAATSTFSGNQKMYIHHEAYNSLIGRIGISAGQETERSNLFAKIALAKEFSGKSDSDFRAEGEKERHEANIDLKDSWIDVEIGGSATLGEDTYLYGTYTMNFGGKVENKWRVDAGIRYRF